MEISRRSFLKGTAAGAGIAAVSLGAKGKMLEKIVPDANAATTAGETFVNSTCRNCPGRCGIRVRVVNGKAVKIDTNPLNPINNFIDGPAKGEGGLCPKGAGGLSLLYDPDRIKGPMKRTNSQKGIDVDPKFVPVSWDEALNDVAGRIKKLRSEGKAKQFVFLGGRGMGPVDYGNMENFTFLLGSPNAIGHGTLCAEGSKTAKYFTDGIKTYSVYDHDNTNYWLVFGANMLEAFRSLSMTLRQYGNCRRGGRQRIKFVYFDTRPSVTGSKADENYLIRPASDGAIACAMAHTILTEGLWNKKFVGDFADGENRFKTGAILDPKDFKANWTHALIEWWNMILKDFTADKAAEISGISADDIKRLAREFAQSQPGIAIYERGPTVYHTGVLHGMAIHALNGLMGSVYSRGGISGVQVGPPFGSLPASVPDHLDEIALQTFEIKKEVDPKTKKEKVSMDVKEKKLPKYQDVPDAHMKGDPYKVAMLMTWMTNPAFSPANPQRYWEVLKDAFVVTYAPWIDDTGIFADYILPDPSYLESWWTAPVYPSLGGMACAQLFQPVVQPLYDTRSFFWTLSELAKRVGGKMGEYYTKIGSVENVLSTLIGGEKIGWTLDQWKEKGTWYKKGPVIPFVHTDGRFYDLTEGGKEMKPDEVKEKVFKTPSGKFEFRSGNKAHKIEEKVEKALEKEGIKDKKTIEAKLHEAVAKAEKDLYPQYREPEWVGGSGFDLFLNSAKMVQHAEGRGSSSRLLQESFDQINNRPGPVGCWMHPETAKSRGIKDGDDIMIESPVGKIKSKAVINPACNPKVVVLPFEMGHMKAGSAVYGRYAWLGSNPDQIVKNVSDPDSGLQSYYQTMVKVSKA